MARKAASTLNKMPQDVLELELTKRARTVREEAPRKGRIKFARNVPPGDTNSKEVIDIVAMAINENADALEWHYDEGSQAGTSKLWAEIIVRAIRYGIPYDDYHGEGFHIRDDDIGDGPQCRDCQEADSA